MARRKQKNTNVFSLFAVLVVVLLALKLLVDNIVFVLESVFVILVIGTLIFVTIRRVKDRQRHRMLKHAHGIINQHLETLCRQRTLLVRSDPYGKLLSEKWHEHIDGFIRDHIRIALTPKQQSMMDAIHPKIKNIIIERTENWIEHNPVFAAFSDSLTPLEFEAFCADQLRVNGWTAQTTRKTGDQGVDVIAEKNGVKIVLQCKLYSGTVGNEAVQQVIGGKGLERAHYCAVVSNSRYTFAAVQLARANGVLLLHYSDLPRLEKRLGMETGSLPNLRESSLFSEAASIASDPSTKTQAFEAVGSDANPISKTRLWAIASAVVVLLALVVTILIPRHNEGARAMKSTYNGRPVATGYTRYNNEQFGYSIDFPTFFVRRIAVNEDGMELISPDGAANLIMAAAKNDRRRTTKEFYDEAIASGSGTLGYHVLGGSWFVVTWDDGNELIYEKMFVGNSSHDWFTFTFPKDQRHIYEPIVTAVEKSFRRGTINQTTW